MNINKYTLKYENVFDANFDSYSEDRKMETLIINLSELNRDYALMKCSEINYKLFKNSDEIDKELICINFPSKYIEIINKFVEKQKEPKFKNPNFLIFNIYSQQKNYVAFWRSQIIRMMFYIIQYCHNDESSKQSDNEFNENFSKSALIVGEFEEKEMLLKDNGNLSDDSKNALHTFKKCSFTHNHDETILFNRIYRGYKIFVEDLGKKLVHQENYTYEEYFKNEYKISLEDCYSYILTFIMHILYTNNSPIFNRSTFFDKVKNPDIRNSFISFLELLSQTPEELISEIEKEKKNKLVAFERLLMSKPIIKLQNNISLISDCSYITKDFISRGISFLFKEKVKKDAFSTYGDCFEEYVCNLLQEKHKSYELQKTIPSGQKVDAFYDLGDGRIVIIEIKACLINEDGNLVKEIDKKYVKKDKDTKEDKKDKAIEQLKKSISYLKDTGKTIYPVLIIEDGFIGNCEFWLKKELKEELSLCGLNEEKVYPLIILPVEILEFEIVKSSKIVDIFSMINEYHNGKFTKDNIGASFTNFISQNYNIKINEDIVNKVSNLLQIAKAKIF